MVTFNAHFDGKVIVPDEPLALKANQKLRISIETIEPSTVGEGIKPKRQLGKQRGMDVYLAPDWDAPLPDEIWEHNQDDQDTP